MSPNNNAVQSASGYDIWVTGRNVEVTDGLKTHVIEKVSKIDRFTDRVIDVHVVLDVQGIQHCANIVMNVGHLVIKAHAVCDDMYPSIDKAVYRLQRQLERYKSRVQDHHAKSLSTVDIDINVLSPHFEAEITDINDAIDDENHRRLEDTYSPHRVVETRKVSLLLLNADEAIMRLELTGDGFLIYRAEEDQLVKVMHRLPDGNFGLIDPR